MSPQKRWDIESRKQRHQRHLYGVGTGRANALQAMSTNEIQRHMTIPRKYLCSKPDPKVGFGR